MRDNVRLRAVTEADLPVLFENQRDPEANRLAAFPPRDREAFWAHWEKILVDATVRARAILFNGELAGTVASFDRDGKRRVGYWLGKEFWGKGIASRALAELLKEERIRPLYAHVAKSNRASLRVLEKNGFTVCGETTFDMSGEVIEDWIVELRADERNPAQ